MAFCWLTQTSKIYSSNRATQKINSQWIFTGTEMSAREKQCLLAGSISESTRVSWYWFLSCGWVFALELWSMAWIQWITYLFIDSTPLFYTFITRHTRRTKVFIKMPPEFCYPQKRFANTWRRDVRKNSRHPSKLVIGKSNWRCLW